jgi:ATP-dependent exoDNAse (exonuclease V) beta subunit
MKKRATALVQELSEIAGLKTALDRLRKLPEAGYTDAQWQILEALISLLRIALAQQELVFQEHGEIDFTAISQAALLALGRADEPTNLALSLDYRIQHLLIDEFQDTSLSQYQLLEQLTAGWQPNEDRTLFCVGDPMQSIYRFREAEVGLYLRARRYGIGELSLTPLTLSVNFRSERGIVEWVNRCFEQVLPKQEDVATGAVSYSTALAIHPGETGSAVQVHPRLGDDRMAEAKQVATLVIKVQQQRPGESCAILVRSRSHLTEIVPQLRAHGLRFRAVEIESMGSRQVVLDLLSLTLALNHPADRIAWLSVLRAPWCGLTLHDLHALCADQPKATIPGLLQQRCNLKGLSNDGQRRLYRVSDILLLCLEQRQRCSLRRWIESAWLALGGPAIVTQARDMEAAETFLEMLDDVDHGAGLSDREALEKQVATLYAPTDPEAGEGLQLMTIHKAKGLEFDTVIVPGLGRRPKVDEQQLLMWIDWPREQGSSELLLAPIKGSGEESNKAYTCIAGLDREKARFEDGRLLYVAATRARRYLHLLGHINTYVRDGSIKAAQPARGSLLAQIWPEVEQEFHHLVVNEKPEAPQHVPAIEMHENRLQRLPANWHCPSPPPPLKIPDKSIPEARTEAQLEFDWAAPTARIVGTVVHSLLQFLPGWRLHYPGQENERIKRFAHSALLQQGLHGRDLQQTLVRVERVFDNMLSDTRGLWITDPKHQQAHNEYSLSGLINGKILNLVIDRCFVDTDGVRWVIDYKSSSHEGGGLEEFLDREQVRYKPQLDRYGQLFALKDLRPIRLGLYYPLLQGWREWGLGD